MSKKSPEPGKSLKEIQSIANTLLEKITKDMKSETSTGEDFQNYLFSIPEMTNFNPDAYDLIITTLTMVAEKYRQQIRVPLEISHACDLAVEILENQMTVHLTKIPDRSVQGKTFKFELVDNKERIDIAEKELHDDYLMRTPNREKIHKHLLEGKKVPGVTLVKHPSLIKSAIKKQTKFASTND